MPDRRSRFQTLLQGLQHSDPRLYDALGFFADDFYDLLAEIHPAQAADASSVVGGEAGQVTGFTYTLYSNNLRFTWDRIPGLVSYELRYQIGTSTDWNTAFSLVHTGTTSADVNPLTIPLLFGTYTFLIQAYNSGGIESGLVSSLVINIDDINVPIISVQIIDNNVLLRWTIPTSQLYIVEYNLYKNDVLSGHIKGNFAAIFEALAGTFTYSVEAVDIAGNVGQRGSVTATVNQPPDFELQARVVSTLSGTKVNAFIEDGKLLVCVNIIETYQQHFDSHTWDGP